MKIGQNVFWLGKNTGLFCAAGRQLVTSGRIVSFDSETVVCSNDNHPWHYFIRISEIFTDKAVANKAAAEEVTEADTEADTEGYRFTRAVEISVGGTTVNQPPAKQPEPVKWPDGIKDILSGLE